MRNPLYRFGKSASKQGLVNYKISARTSVASAAHCFYSSSPANKCAQISKQPKVVDPCPLTNQAKKNFYVVRKGDLIGIYRRFRDCQDQISSSIRDPSVGVFKGYNLQKEIKTFLAAKGLKNAIYTLCASDLEDNLFGNLVLCPLEQQNGLRSSVAETAEKPSPQGTREVIKKPEKIVKPKKSSKKKQNSLDSEVIKEQNSLDSKSCIIEFDGASKGNPGRSGAGAILRAKDRTVIATRCEGLGDTTSNVAEYKALISGLKWAKEKGFKNVQAQGDSELVVKQVKDECKPKKNMKMLYEEVKKLKKNFISFEIIHVKREFNVDADKQANIGAALAAGQVQEELC